MGKPSPAWQREIPVCGGKLGHYVRSAGQAHFMSGPGTKKQKAKKERNARQHQAQSGQALSGLWCLSEYLGSVHFRIVAVLSTTATRDGRKKNPKSKNDRSPTQRRSCNSSVVVLRGFGLLFPARCGVALFLVVRVRRASQKPPGSLPDEKVRKRLH